MDFYEVHAFKYSKRKWTVAAKMENQVDGNVAQARSEELIALAEKLKNKYMTNQISKKTNILVESQSNGYAHGYTPNYIMTKVKTNEYLIGKEIEVILEKVEDEGMSATIVEK